MVVIDANAAVEMAKGTSSGLGLANLICEGEKTITPDLFVHELANICWKYRHTGLLSAAESMVLYHDALGFVDEIHDASDCAVEVLNESIRLDHPAYDIFYLVLARRLGATLLTLDKKLNALADRVGVQRIHQIEFDNPNPCR
ncbi:MAG: type II toxin-antitoxin system VapC family toxin [Eggerthellaceae bacterium]|nr:type II toxin-antitoxin system VapC family toxin [Eggerthellaceae bacterium]